MLTSANSRKVVFMMRYAETQKQLIDRAKLALDAESDYKIAKDLGISARTIGRALKNEHFLNEYNITLLCDVSGLDPFQTLACIRKEEAKAKGEVEKVKFWQKHIAAA